MERKSGDNEFLIVRTEDAKDLPLPAYQTAGSAGMDLYANVKDSEIIEKGEIKLIPLGIKISIPSGYEAQLRPRSGLALKHGISMVNAPGTIDADYRGELKAILINFGSKAYEIKRGTRIAQMVISRVEQIKFEETEYLSATERGEGGYGSTGDR